MRSYILSGNARKGTSKLGQVGPSEASFARTLHKLARKIYVGIDAHQSCLYIANHECRLAAIHMAFCPFAGIE